MKLSVYLQFTLIIISFGMPAYAQLETAHWFFGKKGLNFQQLPPQLITNHNVLRADQPVVLSDPGTGDLLFYSDGNMVWNRNHTAMSNGYNLQGHSHTSGHSYLAVPFPDDADRYYLFTMSYFGEAKHGGLSVFSLYYSEIDMDRNNGLGEVTQKNMHVFDSLGSVITAIPFANRQGYWLIATKTEEEHCFVIWPVTAVGIGNPVKQCTGLRPLNTAMTFNPRMKPSPDGKMLALSHHILGTGPLYLCRFNDTTGIVSEPLAIGNLGWQGGISFSPDSKQLYVAALDSTTLPGYDPNLHNVLHQFDVSTYDSLAIARTLASITIPHFHFNFDRVGDLQLGLDGKLYASRMFRLSDNQATSRRFLAIIQDPNQPGFNSQIRYESFQGQYPLHSTFPNFMSHYFEGLTPQGGSPVTDAPCQTARAYSLYPNPTDTDIAISVSEECFQPYILSIYNAVGQLLLDNYRVNEQASETIEVSALASGVYFAVISAEGKKIGKKFVKR
ncbi:MAG: T9SS type A sorting domain-containing protein [Cyclobacteriaceae bacterium]|nr:T9SS type A sorting domain-containing protein [Cyclobacteriaceae bacterium]